MQLASQLLKHLERLTSISSRPPKVSLLSRVYPITARDHNRLERIKNKVKIYVIYSYLDRKIKKPAEIRKPLQQLLVNTVKTSRLNIRKRSQQILRGLFNYKLYRIAIYNHIRY